MQWPNFPLTVTSYLTCSSCCSGGGGSCGGSCWDTSDNVVLLFRVLVLTWLTRSVIVFAILTSIDRKLWNRRTCHICKLQWLSCWYRNLDQR